MYNILLNLIRFQFKRYITKEVKCCNKIFQFCKINLHFSSFLSSAAYHLLYTRLELNLYDTVLCVQFDLCSNITNIKFINRSINFEVVLDKKKPLPNILNIK